jgi:hypothetical protein
MEDVRENAANKADVLQPFMFHYPVMLSFAYPLRSIRLHPCLQFRHYRLSFASILQCWLQSMPKFNNVDKGDLAPLRALQNEPPTTRMALVRQLWPEISAALTAGHRLTEVHQRLVAGQFDVPYRTLVYCVNRIRLEQARAKPLRPRAVTNADHKRAPTSKPSDRADPLANLEKYGTASLPGFHFTGDLPDPDKLF